jgi:hypothetical protein
MKNAFAEIEEIGRRYIDDNRTNMGQEILDVLQDQGIRIRQDDDQLRQLTLSKPLSVDSGFVIGLRYNKRDGTRTEDLFRVESGHPIQAYYKGSLQRQFPEYQGTHKQRVVYEIVATEPAPTTSANTIAVVKNKP